MSEALSLPPRDATLSRLLELGSAGRRTYQRRRPPNEEPSFWPGRPAGTVYPQGYTLDQLGPLEH